MLSLKMCLTLRHAYDDMFLQRIRKVKRRTPGRWGPPLYKMHPFEREEGKIQL